MRASSTGSGSVVVVVVEVEALLVEVVEDGGGNVVAVVDVDSELAPLHPATNSATASRPVLTSMNSQATDEDAPADADVRARSTPGSAAFWRDLHLVDE